MRFIAWRALPVVALVLSISPLPAYAYGDDVNLTGLNDFQVTADVAPTACGPTKNDIITGIQSVLSSTPSIRLSTSSPVSLYVNVNVLDDCTAANVYIEVDGYVVVQRTGRTVFQTIWGSHGTLLGGEANMRQRIIDDSETLARNFVTAWTSKN